MPLGGDGGIGHFLGAVFVRKVLAADRAVEVFLDTLICTGGGRTVHLGEAVPLGGDGGVGQLRGAVFVLEVLAADRAVVMLPHTLFRAGGRCAVHMGKGMPGGWNLFVGGVIAAGAGVIGFPADF